VEPICSVAKKYATSVEKATETDSFNRISKDICFNKEEMLIKGFVLFKRMGKVSEIILSKGKNSHRFSDFYFKKYNPDYFMVIHKVIY
jgi:hypothetical protein